MSSGIQRVFAGRDGTEPPRAGPPSWGGALVVIAGVAAVLWIVQIANAADHYGFDQYGLGPRRAGGLWGVVTEPFLHASYSHLASNTVPLLALGWVVLLSGLRIWAMVTAFVVLVGGFFTWLVGPSNTVIVGASGMIFGWLGYLLGRALFSRRFQWIVVAVLVLIFFGSLLYGVFPTLNSQVSWQAHLCGFLAGVAVAGVLHLRRGGPQHPRRAVVS